ncbi:hypothetical protein [Clostridium ihumii]|uniref:hypothetical protein n=1 Tax=Clostridium ihumii TaxID=1470356 RepID=UPI0005515543|nr:hypothetical protein [Clostridium ihumii]
MQYLYDPKNIVQLGEELKQIIDDYWDKKITKDICSYYIYYWYRNTDLFNENEINSSIEKIIGKNRTKLVYRLLKTNLLDLENSRVILVKRKKVDHKYISIEVLKIDYLLEYLQIRKVDIEDIEYNLKRTNTDYTEKDLFEYLHEKYSTDFLKSDIKLPNWKDICYSHGNSIAVLKDINSLNFMINLIHNSSQSEYELEAVLSENIEGIDGDLQRFSRYMKKLEKILEKAQLEDKKEYLYEMKTIFFKRILK